MVYVNCALINIIIYTVYPRKVAAENILYKRYNPKLFLEYCNQTIVSSLARPMKVDIMFLINHFQKVGEGYFIIFFYTKSSSDEHTCDAKGLTSYESETDHHVWQGNIFLERLGF